MGTSRPIYGPISSYSRVQILHLVQERAHRTIGELTTATGLHANTVREHLQRLIDGGYVVEEREQRTTRGRPRVLYSAATGEASASSPIARRKVQDAASRGDLLRRAMPWTATDTLPSEATHQLDALVEHLEESGFEPIVDEATLTVDLSPCTHASAHNCHLQTLCRVHVGLMQSVLTQAGGPLSARGVRPAQHLDECIVELELHPDSTQEGDADNVRDYSRPDPEP